MRKLSYLTEGTRILKTARLIPLVMLVVSCAGTNITSRMFEEDFYDKVNRTARNSKGEIALKNGQTVTGRQISVDEDTTSWISSDTGNNQNVATKEIEAITFIDHGRGRAEGIGIGILVGAAIAGGVGKVGSQNTATTVAIGFGVGGLVGLIAGGETGGKEMFIFTGRKEDSAP